MLRIKYTLWGAGIFNLAGVLIFSLCFTNPHLNDYYPLVFSNFGLIAIMLWGLAYISVAGSYMHVRELMFVFAVEKLVYVISWVGFLMTSGHLLPEIFEKSIMSGLFLSAYGLGDFIFGCFFSWVGIRGYRITS